MTDDASATKPSEGEETPRLVADSTARLSAPEPPRKARGKRMALGTLATLFCLGLVASVVLWSFAGRAISAPEFLKSRVEARIAEALPGLTLTFGDLQASIDTDGTTQVALRDVDVTTRFGAPVAQLSDLDLDLAPLALLRGDVRLTGARLSGANLTVIRTADGDFALAFGEMMPDGSAAPDLPALVARLGEVLNDPVLSDLARVDADALTLRYEDARAGRGWTIDGGRVRALRDGDDLRLSSDLALLNGGTEVTSIEVNADATVGEAGLRFGMSFDNMRAADIATQSAALAWIGALRAPISGALRSEMFADGTLGPLNATLQIGKGVLQPNARTRPVPFSSARAYFRFDPLTQDIEFSEISVDSAWGRAQADGRASMLGGTDGWPDQMVAQFVISEVEANPDGFFERPVRFDRAEVDMRLRLDPFRIDIGRMRVDDEKLPLRMKGHIDAQAKGWGMALDAKVAQVDAATIAAHWPPTVVPRTRKWFSENVSSGQMSDLQFSARLVPEAKPVIHLSTRFSDAAVRYAKTLPVIEDGAGQLTILRNRLVVLLDRGRAVAASGGTIRADGTRVVIPDIRQKPAMAAIDVKGSAPLPAILSYLNSDRLNLLDKAGLPVDLGTGQARFAGQLLLPLKKGRTAKDLAWTFTGDLRDVDTSKLVPNRRLTSPALSLAVDKSRIVVSGKGAFDGVPFDGRFEQPFGPDRPKARLAATVELSNRFLTAFGVSLPKGTLDGAGQAKVALTGIGRGSAPAFTLSSNLRGVSIRIPPVGWSKTKGSEGSFEISGALGPVPKINGFGLRAPGLRADGDITLRSDRTLDKIVLNRANVGQWLDAKGILRGQGKGRPLAVTLTGGRIDMRGVPSGGASNGGGGAPLALSLDRLQVSNDIYLTDFQGEFRSGGGLQGAFSALLKGVAPISGELVPRPSGRSAIRLRSDRADRVVTTLGLLKQAQGGDLVVTLNPRAAPGQYDGTARIRNIRMRDAPAVASLLDAISIVGLIDQLGGPGIAFTEVDAEFRIAPGQVVVKRSSAVGPSMGLSLDGYYNTDSGTLDMQGVLSPIYLVNGIGAIFTRKGEGLIGFNFALKGEAKSPRVSVNPFSVLTPGMFREIFRRPPPELSQ